MTTRFMRTMQLVLALSLSAWDIPSRAHEGGHSDSGSDIRSWHYTDGSHFHGSFVSASTSEVRILSARGGVWSMPIDRLDAKSRTQAAHYKTRVEALNKGPTVRLVTQVSGRANAKDSGPRPAMADAFKAFEKSVSLRWNQEFLFVESNGIPNHPMMVGIRSWQQQVPLPQPYRGDNAWRIPLHPVPAKTPVSANGRFLRGAIALAVNGIPIFNPLNNRGDDAYLVGELDEFGGHCGRADDYHYHVAPIHLQATVGKGQPIAYALDGYPIYGYQDPGAPDFAPLDQLNGHKDAGGNYHYHATPKYPYINGGFYGVVVERDGQVDPQPRAEPVRPALPPLRGATITQFQRSGATSLLTYEIRNRPGSVRTTQNENGTVDFVFTEPNGHVRTETYSVRRGHSTSDFQYERQ